MYFSQFGQDKFLNSIFKDDVGIFVDVGAHDGITINNTLYFENKGWTGYNIEPIPSVYDKLCINRPNCININCAITSDVDENTETETTETETTETTETTADFYKNVGYTEMISGLVKSYDRRHLERLQRELQLCGGTSEIVKVKTRTLSSICKEHKITKITYLSIDVEGAEFDVLKSIDYEYTFIDIIGFENNYPDVSKDIISFLQKKGFKVLNNSADIFMINTKSKYY
jgi:FkbM family methyltransferase